MTEEEKNEIEKVKNLVSIFFYKLEKNAKKTKISFTSMIICTLTAFV